MLTRRMPHEYGVVGGYSYGWGSDTMIQKREYYCIMATNVTLHNYINELKGIFRTCKGQYYPKVVNMQQNNSTHLTFYLLFLVP